MHERCSTCGAPCGPWRRRARRLRRASSIQGAIAVRSSAASSPAGSFAAAMPRPSAPSSRSRTRLAPVSEAMRSTSCRCLASRSRRRRHADRPGRRRGDRRRHATRAVAARRPTCAAAAPLRMLRVCLLFGPGMTARPCGDVTELLRTKERPQSTGAPTPRRPHVGGGGASAWRPAHCSGSDRLRRPPTRSPSTTPSPRAAARPRAASSGGGRRAARGCRRGGAPAPAGWRAA